MRGYFDICPLRLPVDRILERRPPFWLSTTRGLPTHFTSCSFPKDRLPALAELDPAADDDFLVELYATAQSLIEEFHLAEGGYRLIVNGGAYQDFPYLHFHLVSDVKQQQAEG